MVPQKFESFVIILLVYAIWPAPRFGHLLSVFYSGKKDQGWIKMRILI